MLLGKHTPVVDEYAPQLLYPIPRADGRSELGLGRAAAISWVSICGMPTKCPGWTRSGKPVVQGRAFHHPGEFAQYGGIQVLQAVPEFAEQHAL